MEVKDIAGALYSRFCRCPSWWKKRLLKSIEIVYLTILPCLDANGNFMHYMDGKVLGWDH